LLANKFYRREVQTDENAARKVAAAIVAEESQAEAAQKQEPVSAA
jgi:hypothetical protein